MWIVKKQLMMARFVPIMMLLSVATGSVRAGERYHDSKKHWSVELPAGWKDLRQEIVNNTEALISQRLSEKDFSYVHGFTKDPQGEQSLPYILVQITNAPLKGVSAKEIEQALSATELKAEIDKTKTSFSDLMESMDVGKPALDLEHKRIYTKMSMNVEGQGQMRGLAIGFLGNDGIVQLNFYAEKNAFEAQVPEFEKMIETFQYEPGYELTLTASAMPPWMRGGLIGGVVGGVAAAMVGIFKRIKK